MALNDDALFTAAKGYLYVAPVGTLAPTAAQVAAFNQDITGSEVQTVAITGSPTGGSFTLTFGGQTTAGIAHNATAATVQTALRALTTIGSNGVTVAGGPLPATAVTVTFTGTLAGTDVAQLTGTASLTGGTTPAVNISTGTPGWSWTSLGHTAREELPEFGFDGGEAETRGTWQNDALKEVITEATVDYVTFNLHQFDELALSLYYGQLNAAGAGVGEFHVTNSGQSTERSLFMVVVDGDAKIGFYARKASIRREGPIALAVDEFSSLPLRATFLKDGTNDLFRWISQDMPVNPAP